MKTPALFSRVELCLAAALLGAASSGCGCGPACPTDGTGTLSVTVTGLPPGLSGTPVKVTAVTGSGPAWALGADDSRSTPAGLYEVTAEKVAVADPTVRTVYAGRVSNAQACVPAGQTQAVTVTYAPIPTSGKAWWTNGNAANELVGYASSTLQASGSPAATAGLHGPAGKDVAFDQDGNLWSLGPTTADALLNRFSASAFAASGALTPDRAIAVADLSCLPAAAGLAFHESGDAFVSSPCSHQVLRLPASRLGGSGTVAPSARLSGARSPQGVAFDANGNLWVGDLEGAAVLRYDAAHLGADAAAADLTIQVTLAGGGRLPPSFLAFDAAGRLWAVDFGGNRIFRLDPAQLEGVGTKSVAPAVAITLDVAALLEGLAFDEGGGLWVAGAAGRFVRLAPAQLSASSGAGSPTVPEVVISSADVGSAANVAFFPAAPGLPLYHRWR